MEKDSLSIAGKLKEVVSANEAASWLIVRDSQPVACLLLKKIWCIRVPIVSEEFATGLGQTQQRVASVFCNWGAQQ